MSKSFYIEHRLHDEKKFVGWLFKTNCIADAFLNDRLGDNLIGMSYEEAYSDLVSLSNNETFGAPATSLLIKYKGLYNLHLFNVKISKWL